MADRFSGRLTDSPYFGRYDRLTTPWRLVLADVDGEPMIIAEHAEEGVWTARSIVRLRVRDDRIVEIADYEHCPWVLRAPADVRTR